MRKILLPVVFVFYENWLLPDLAVIFKLLNFSFNLIDLLNNKKNTYFGLSVSPFANAMSKHCCLVNILATEEKKYKCITDAANNFELVQP